MTEGRAALRAKHNKLGFFCLTRGSQLLEAYFAIANRSAWSLRAKRGNPGFIAAK
jgi:hypothetical protein